MPWAVWLVAGVGLTAAAALSTVAVTQLLRHRASPRLDALWLGPLFLVVGAAACFAGSAWWAVMSGL